MQKNTHVYQSFLKILYEDYLISWEKITKEKMLLNIILDILYSSQCILSLTKANMSILIMLFFTIKIENDNHNKNY